MNAVRIRRLCKLALSEPDDDDDFCRRCGGFYHCPSELERTPLCNLCAQEVLLELAVGVPEVLDRAATRRIV